MPLAVTSDLNVTSQRKPSTKQLDKAVLDLLADRGTATACPSEVARALAPDWRPLMESVRAAAARLQRRGKVDVYQHGKPVQLEETRGPIRLRAADVKNEDYRREPQRYRVGRGEEGVLTVKPYKRPRTTDLEKAKSAEVFRVYWQRALKDRHYLALRRRHEASPHRHA